MQVRKTDLVYPVRKTVIYEVNWYDCICATSLRLATEMLNTICQQLNPQMAIGAD